jgi:FtsZ-interacting cell division protein ZipA
MNNDIMTLILASSILAAGGLGLYVFHSNKDERHSVRFKNDDDNDSDDDSYDEIDNNEDKHEQTSYNEDKPSRTRSSGKTKKVRRQTKGSKRRY